MSYTDGVGLGCLRNQQTARVYYLIDQYNAGCYARSKASSRGIRLSDEVAFRGHGPATSSKAVDVEGLLLDWEKEHSGLIPARLKACLGICD